MQSARQRYAIVALIRMIDSTDLDLSVDIIRLLSGEQKCPRKVISQLECPKSKETPRKQLFIKIQ